MLSLGGQTLKKNLTKFAYKSLLLYVGKMPVIRISVLFHFVTYLLASLQSAQSLKLTFLSILVFNRYVMTSLYPEHSLKLDLNQSCSQ